MIYITAQPDRIKFAWQLEIQLANFREHGIAMSDVHILVGSDVPQSREMQALRRWGANVFFYPYEKDYRYISSVRPHLLKKHFALFPELEHEYLFYLDCDVIFRRVPDWELEFSLDGTWYMSDCRGYLGARYILREGGPQVLLDMCAIVGIDPFEVKRREMDSGGAQILMRGATAAFWAKCEQDMIALYTSHPNQYDQQQKAWVGPNKERYDAVGNKAIQIWCADMWAVLWNAWLAGHCTRVAAALSFSWAHNSIETYHERTMLHMAGVSERTQSNAFAPHFDKLKYSHRYPFEDDFSHVNPASASTVYLGYFKQFQMRQRVQEQKENFEKKLAHGFTHLANTA